MKTQNYKAAFIKALLFVSAIILICFSFGCSNDEPYRFNNTYIIFDPENLEEIYVLHPSRENTVYNDDRSFNFEGALKVNNGEGFLVNLELTAQYYTISVKTDYKVHYITFSGYDGKIQDWKREGNKFYLEAGQLEPTENGFYLLSLAEDKLK